MISISFGSDNDKKPGRVYRKVTAENIIYYSYESYPKGSSHPQYYFPVIRKIIPRTNSRWDDNNQDIYYMYRPIQQPYYPVYPYPQPYYRSIPYPYYTMYRSFATNNNGFIFGGTAPDNGFNYDPTKTQKGSPAKGSLTPATPSAKDNLIKNNPQKSGETVTPFGNAKGEPNLPYSKKSDGTPATSTNPSSGCQNCKALDYPCMLAKYGCEAGHIAQDTFGNYWPWIVGGGAIILMILLLK